MTGLGLKFSLTIKQKADLLVGEWEICSEDNPHRSFQNGFVSGNGCNPETRIVVVRSLPGGSPFLGGRGGDVFHKNQTKPNQT